MITYQKLAPVYDLINKNVPYKKEVEFLKKTLSSKQNTSILDVCCGTGEHLQYFESDQFETCGIDIAKGMIKIAKQKHPNRMFRCADMRTFRINKNFDLVYSLGSSLQYNLTLRDLEKTISNLIKHSKNKVIFDMRYCLEKWQNGYVKDCIHENEKHHIHESWISHREGNYSIWEPNYVIYDKLTKEKMSYTDHHKIYLFSINDVTQILEEKKLDYKIIDINKQPVNKKDLSKKHFYFLISISN
jgi:SAM-dependent methyltransferase